MKRQAPGIGGFTLLEVIIAMALAALVLSAAYGTFFAANRAMQGTGERLTELQELRVSLDMLRRELEAAAAANPKYPIEIQDRDVYNKQASSLSFTTYGSNMPGPVTVKYFVKEGPEGRLILMKSLRRAQEQESEAREAEMVEDLEYFKVEARSTSSADWVLNWDEKSSPYELRLTLSVKSGNTPLALSFIARPLQGLRL